MTVEGLLTEGVEARPELEERHNCPVGFADLFKIGIGPSSSHTIGPMCAAATFLDDLRDQLSVVHRLCGTAFGSLAWTGRGHATDKAMILGLAGQRPESIAPDDVDRIVREIAARQTLVLPNGRSIAFVAERDITFDTVNVDVCDRHPNTMIFEAFDAVGRSILRQVWFSIGGGFVEREGAAVRKDCGSVQFPFPHSSARSLLDIGRINDLRIDQIVLANETARSNTDVFRSIDEIARIMFACIERGLASSGELPGGLFVRRRAKEIYDRLRSGQGRSAATLMDATNYVSAFAIAVSEENAAGGQVVTAPTNGAAGVCPAVLRYYTDFCNGASRYGIHRFFLSATAIGGIIKRNASISGAEVGCQGEVGSAAAMAAAGLASALGGTNTQIENAAEIAMEHHLGMTCDPVGGLVKFLALNETPLVPSRQYRQPRSHCRATGCIVSH